MKDLLGVHLVVGGFIIVCCGIALRFRMAGIIFRRLEFEPEHIWFLNTVLWFVIASLVYIILRDIWRIASA